MPVQVGIPIFSHPLESYGEAHVIRSEVRFDLVILDSVANGMQIYVEYTRATSMREHQV